MGNALLGTPGSLQPDGTSWVSGAQPLRAAWCCRTESSPLLPAALDKVLLSLGLLPDCQWKPAENCHVLVLKALQKVSTINTAEQQL